MNILIYGANGWIGHQFINYIEKQNIKYTSGKSRADNEKNIIDEIMEIKPTHVISFIGRTHGTIGTTNYETIDYLERSGKIYENVRDNLYAPIILAEICKEKNIHYTYIGTGCIFNYDDKHTTAIGYTEEDTPNFFGSSYSVVKGFTDRLMKIYEKTTLNLRIRMPISDEKNPRNFITKITKYTKICSIDNSMTVLPELIPIMVDMMQKQLTGNFNFTNPDCISHNEILTMYKEIVDNNFKWTNFTIDDQRKILLSERSNNYLDTTKLQKLYPNILNIHDAVRKCLIEYKKNLDSENISLLITGGCGFIGSNFINYYFNKHYNNIKYLINIDAMYYCASKLNINENIRNNDKYNLVIGNTGNTSLVANVLTKYNITHVINFAAQSHVQNSFDDSLTYTTDNIVGTHTLLEECRKYGKIKKFIQVSTDEVYGESMIKTDEMQKTEFSILCPTNPYAATKAASELIAQSYQHSYKMPIIITRGNNVYGPNQYPEKLVPLFIKLLRENKKLTIHGKGSTVRAFLHVYDTVKAFECILEKGKIGEIYNIGCDDGMEYTVMEVSKILINFIKNTEKYDEWLTYVKDRPFNDTRYYISNQKLKDMGWNITTDFITGIKNLIALNENMNKYNKNM